MATPALAHTETGLGIKLFLNGNVIEGRADDNNKATVDPVVFRLHHRPGHGLKCRWRSIAPSTTSMMRRLRAAHDEVATMLSGKLSVTLTVSDKDGDTVSASKDISGSINVDYDSPKAECDYECVVEGTHGEGELNYVTGNIVTGNGDTIFGNDANNLDGNADNPGADQPYTISKISHGGNTYELSADHQSVSNLGPDDDFDPATGILTIKTAEGGTLEIVLVSDNQDEVGDYKYTVPADADHDHDIAAGPEDLATSISTTSTRSASGPTRSRRRASRSSRRAAALASAI